jgi:thymidylate synthase (FAD)
MAREWFRHTIGFARNEVSRRYVDDEPTFHIPEFRTRAPSKKQGSNDDVHPENALIYELMAEHCRDAFTTYDHLLKNNVPPEQARMVLPVATYTEWTWASDLHNLLHFLRLRTAPNAQDEIRAYANAIEGIVSAAFPLTHAAWAEHVRDAVTLSASAQRALAAALRAGSAPDLSALPPRERADVEAWIAGGAK